MDEICAYIDDNYFDDRFYITYSYHLLCVDKLLGGFVMKAFEYKNDEELDYPDDWKQS